MSELKPCPHCGGEAELRRSKSGDYTVRCAECGARTRQYHENEGGAMWAWNRRAERTCTAELNEQRDAVVCSACGSSMMLCHWTEMLDWGRTPRISSFTTYPYCPNCGARVIGGAE